MTRSGGSSREAQEFVDGILTAAAEPMETIAAEFRRVERRLWAMRSEIVALGARLEAEYAAATARDPGLEAAWARAREVDPAVGWLDVARVRDAAWWEIAPGSK